MIVYKIVLKEGNKIKTLFHGVNRSKTLPYNIWIIAEKKLGKDGSNQEPYLTGFHCFKEIHIAKKYLKKFRSNKNRIIIECEARNLRQKPSNKDVFLADEIYIKE
jgi:hypothetical protein